MLCGLRLRELQARLALPDGEVRLTHDGAAVILGSVDSVNRWAHALDVPPHYDGRTTFAHAVVGGLPVLITDNNRGES